MGGTELALCDELVRGSHCVVPLAEEEAQEDEIASSESRKVGLAEPLCLHERFPLKALHEESVEGVDHDREVVQSA